MVHLVRPWWTTVSPGNAAAELVAAVWLKVQRIVRHYLVGRRVSPNPPMDGVRTLEGGEEVTDAMVRARIRVDGGLAAVCRRFWGRRWRPTVAVVSEMAGRGHGKRRSRTGLARVGGEVQLAGTLGHWRTGAVRPGVEWLATGPRRD